MQKLDWVGNSDSMYQIIQQAVLSAEQGNK